MEERVDPDAQLEIRDVGSDRLQVGNQEPDLALGELVGECCGIELEVVRGRDDRADTCLNGLRLELRWVGVIPAR